MKTNLNKDWKKDRIGSAYLVENPMVIAKRKCGFAVIGDTQFLPGYYVLLPLVKVNSLNDLDLKQRNESFLGMSLIGEATQEVCKPRRINCSICGNMDVFYMTTYFHGMNGNPRKENICRLAISSGDAAR